MLERVDRLNDDFWTENELEQMARAVIEPSRYDQTPKHLCWYYLMKDGTFTGKAMLLIAESIVDGLDAVNRFVEPVGLTAVIGEYGDESVHAAVKVQGLYMALEKYQYIGKLDFVGMDKVFTYEPWMAKLV